MSAVVNNEHAAHRRGETRSKSVKATKTPTSWQSLAPKPVHLSRNGQT